MLIRDKWFLTIAYLYRRSLRGRGSWPLAGTHRIQRVVRGRNIVRGCLRKSVLVKNFC